MAGHPLVALDLDRTLIYSRAAGGGLPGARLVETYDGAPASWMTDNAWHRLAELMDRAEVVTVTTRSTEQYQRVRLPRIPAYALCSNGGTLLVEGVPDRGWRARSLEIAAGSAPLSEVRRCLDEVADAPWVRLVREVEGLFCYLVAQSREAIPVEWLAGLAESADRAGWTTSLQGRKVYLVPQGVDKASGVQRLRERLGDLVTTTLAAGDSLLDAGMLLAADRAIRPAHGELHDTGWSAGGIDVTVGAGIAAGEEIVLWALERLGATAVSVPAPS
ncbi:MAG TPA: HAD hydrolase family protein [Nocardioides sp.]|nr:HAD hydrolase family protein [Nocardioides sp.]